MLFRIEAGLLKPGDEIQVHAQRGRVEGVGYAARDLKLTVSWIPVAYNGASIGQRQWSRFKPSTKVAVLKEGPR